MRKPWILPLFAASLALTATLQACGTDADSIFGPGSTTDEAGASSTSGNTSFGGFPPSEAGLPPDPEPDGSAPIDCDANPGACLPPGVCGDGKPGLGESCDDGNTNANDGCSPTCAVEAPYWQCAFGTPCIDVRICEADAGDAGDAGNCVIPPKQPVCGDGVIDDGEVCDDRNVAGNDGCSADCKAVEANWACPTPGAACVTTVVCGDRKITGSETCDDGNRTAGDGCSANCRLETGWSCPVVGIECVAARCGDGRTVGDEQCDDGNATNNDGCSSSCQLQARTTVNNGNTTTPPSSTTTNYVCAYPATPLNPVRQVCTATTCGNNQREGSEQCDDNNTRPFDGCSPSCALEPRCPNGTCTAVCGDGLLANYDGNGDGRNDEACDDGNTANGDGCSSTCQVERGYQCSNAAGSFPDFLDLPVVIRDFKYYDSGDNTSHPDFQRYECTRVSPGLVQNTLSTGLNGVPRFRWDGTGNDPSGNDANGDCGRQLTNTTSINDWFTDGNRSRRIIDKQLRLVRNGTAGNYSYVFDSAVHEPWATKGGFFPIDGEGWGNQGGNAHNFAFTTELRYWFTYTAGQTAQLDFSGDDDVWVFINGRLALDVGGLHPRQDRSFTLNDTTAGTLGLQSGRLYEIALFHAERHTTDSNFKLTLRGFVKNPSVCTNVCGDGIRTREEQCDLGSGANGNKPPGSVPYGGCTTACTLGPYCGDNVRTDPPEACDDGVNLTSWQPTSSGNACAPECKAPAYCGDGKLDSSFGETCDRGADNVADANAYGKCTTSCKFGPRCGDGKVDASGGEECDNGFNVGSYVKHPSPTDCAPSCKKPKSCGDGNVDLPFEQCDQGANNSNTGAYGSCTTECVLGPRCGDGVRNGPAEQCDDGNNRAGDGCSPTCRTEGGDPQ